MLPERIREFLDGAGVVYEIHEHPREVAAQRLAAVEHVTGWTIAKPVLLQAGQELVMAVVPSPLHVDLEKVRATLARESVHLAAEGDFAGVFPDCELGAEPPFGNLYGLRVCIDTRLLAEPKLVCRAGTHTATLVLDTSDFLRLVQPTEADIAEP